jgi:hypothetical protein
MGKHWGQLHVDPEYVVNARAIAEIPERQLPHGEARNDLIARALRGEVEAYRPIGSQSYNLWFEKPARERTTLRDWLLLEALRTSNR